MESNKVLVEEQNGFRQDRSCLDHLHALFNTISYQKSQKKSAFICYVDAKKAFDNVNRSCLWYKLQKLGIKGKIFSAIKSLYRNVECTVRINGDLTKWFTVSNGLKQGCVVSPTLFALYANDLAEEIKALNCGIPIGEQQISILMFADDIALITDSEDKMQQMLNTVFRWCRKWRLALNTGKTKIVHYRPERCERSQFEFMYGNSKVEITNKNKSLGLWLQEHQNSSDMVKPLAASASRALGCLMTKFHNVGNMTHSVFSHLYDSLVAPILNYGAGIWGTQSFSVVNTVQNRACRFFLGVGKTAGNCATRGDMGWKPQTHRQYAEVLRLYHRAETVDPQRINSIVHNFCKTKKARTIWINKVGKLCKRIGYEYEDTSCSSKLYVDKLQECLKLVDQEEWYQELHNDKNCPNGNKLRTYRLHKDRISTEPYVTANISRYERSILAKLRSGTLPLEVETGRYRQVPLDERTCKLCQASIENEIHFLVDCHFYNDIRYELFNLLSIEFPDFNDQPSTVKYILIMLSSHMVMVGKTVLKMYSRRKLYS